MCILPKGRGWPDLGEGIEGGGPVGGGVERTVLPNGVSVC